jgi:hypothetical protein
MQSVKLFENLMSPQKEVREQAEKDLAQLQSLPVSQSCPVFAEAMSSPTENIFQLSTLMLKKTFCDDKNKLEKLTPEEKNSLLELVKSKIDFTGAKSWKSLQRIGEALSPLYQATNLSNGFVDILKWFSDQTNPASRKFAIFLIEVLCTLNAVTEKVLDNTAINNFKEIFTKGLDDENIDVKVSTLNCVTQFLINISNEKLLLQFSGLTDKMLSALVSTLKHENEQKDVDIADSKGKTALETMIEIIDQHPKFWKGKEDTIITIVNEISKGKIFKNQIRECALELVYSLAKSSPSSIKKAGQFKLLFIPLLFNLMLEVDNENDEKKWEKNIEENEAEFDEMFYAVRDSFDRLALDLGGDYFMGVTAELIKKYLSSSNWVEVHAAFTAMAYMSEGCKDSYSKNIKELLQFINTGLTHQHPRVRYAALFAFGSVLKSTAPKPQKEFTNNILPALAQLMSDKESSIRVKTQSCNSLVEFLRGLVNEENSAKLLSNFTADLVKLLSQLFEYSLKESYSPLQEASLSALSLLSNILEKEFAPFYDQLMPGLKKLFFGLNAQTQEQKKLKSNTIETMSFLCSSISEDRDKYLTDLNEIANAFLNYMKTIPEEDPQLSSILNGFTHLSLALKDKFEPILVQLLPILKNFIAADIGFKAEDAALDEYIPADKKEKSKLDSVIFNLGANQTKLSLNTFALQNKILSFTVLYDIANDMGTAFAKYIEELLNISKSLLESPFSPKLRKIAAKSLKAALAACPNEQDKKKVIDIMGDSIIKAYKKALEKNFKKDIKVLLKALTFAFELVKDKMNFSEKFITEFYACLGGTCKIIDESKKILLDTINKKKLDEDEEEEMLEDYDYLSEIERKVMEVSGILFKLFGEPLTALVTQNLYDSFLNNWNSNLDRKQFKSDLEILCSLCFFDDFMEFGDIQGVILFVPTYVNNTCNYDTTNEDLLQSTVFGYGVICKRLTRDQFKEFNSPIITYIAKLMQREVNEDNGRTYDNAVSAMGKYLIYQSNNDANSLNMAKQFIKLLPLKYDLEECKVISEELFNQIKNNNPLFVNDTTLPEIKQSIVDIKNLNDEKKFLEEQENNLKEVATKLGL